MNNKQMLAMLEDGYTPEYVSLTKWKEIQHQLVNGGSRYGYDISSATCALCEVNRGYEHLCRNCTLYKLVNCACGSFKSPWSRVLLSDEDHMLKNVTDLVNHLQLLVTIHGVKTDEV